MSNYLPPAILPTPPNYQDQQLHNAKNVVDFSTTNVIPNSLLGRPHPMQQQSTDTMTTSPIDTSMMAPGGVAGNAAGLGPSVVGSPPVPNGVAPAKMFVGGLPQSVTQETLNEYFGRYGNIVEAFVLMDDQSGRSRGFGFVTFENAQSLNDVLAARPHYLAGKHVDCKHAVLKSSTSTNAASSSRAAGENEKINFTTMHPLSQQQQQQQRPSFDDRTMEPGGDNTTNDDDDLFLTGGGKSYLALSGDKWLEDCAEADERKIFVGGLPDVTPAEFAGFFEHFGPVADAMVMFDRKRRRQRGFGFITFATNDGVTNALKYHRHPVKGKLVEVKKAHPLVLQKARAPARRERDQQLQAQQGQSRRGSPSLGAAKRKTSLIEAQAPWAAEGTMPARHQDPWKRLRPDEEEDVFKQMSTGEMPSVGGGGLNSMSSDVPTSSVSTTGFDARQTKFPLAPWNQQLTLESQQMKLEELRSIPPNTNSETSLWHQNPQMSMMPPQQHQGLSPYYSNAMEPKPQMFGPDQHYPSPHTAGNPPFYAQPFSTVQQQPPMFAAPYQQSQTNDPYLSVSGYGIRQNQYSGQGF